MNIIKAYHCAVLQFVLCLISAGCGAGGGKDAMSSHTQSGYSTSSICLTCHSSQNSTAIDPLVTNGSGTAGKHVLHVTERGIECTKCHLLYISESTHMNGTPDVTNPTAHLVSFDSTNPNGRWIDDTGPGTGSCSNLACHGPQTPEWYGAISSLPDCSICHNGTLDPAVTNGSGTEGKHIIHVTNRSIPCLKCHTDYTNHLTHMNGSKDTSDPTVRLVYFDSTNPAGSWINDTGPSTGSCSSLACHGPQTPDWYGTLSTLPDCSVCHTGSLDPLLTNGSGSSGKHILHVTTRGIACAKCHQNYTNQFTHMNGTKDTTDPAISLVFFDATNSTGTWIHDTGPSTGACSSLACHGAESPNWYGAGSSLPACSACHSGAYDPVTIDAGAGKHQIHAVDYQISCTKCHNSYPSYPTHMNGVLNTSSTGVTIIYFDPTIQQGQWSYATGICSTIYCHSNGTSVATSAVPSGSSPAWSSSTVGCTLCHGNTSFSDWRASSPLYSQDQPKSNNHANHMYGWNIGCNYCHYSTTRDNVSIFDRTKHVNGVYDVIPQSNATYTVLGTPVLVNFTYTYDPGGGTCSNITCHTARGINARMTWGEAFVSVSVNSTHTANCEVRFIPYPIGGTSPYTYLWNFGDGTTSTEQSPVHVFPSGTTSINVYVTARDANRHPGTTMVPLYFDSSFPCN